jgi:type I restriction enzyme, S subunit
MAWEVKKLGEVIKLEYGKPLPEEKRNSNGKYPVYGANGEIGRSDEYNYDKPSIIVGRKGSAGELNLTEEKFWPLDVTYFVTFDNKKHDLHYIYYVLKKLKLSSLAKGVKPGINRNEIYSISVRIPPLVEQKRIVAILDKTFENIVKVKENAEQNLKNAKEIFESYLQSIFGNKGKGWTEMRLVEVCEIKPPKSEAKNKLKQTDFVSFVPMEDLGINQKILIPNKERTLKEVEGSYTYFANGDVLLAKITPCFENGKLSIAENLKNGVGFGSSEYIVFRTNEKLFSEYLYYFLLRSKFREEGAKRMMGAVGHKRVSKEFIENSIITLPSFPEQKSIVQKLDALSEETIKLEEIYNQKLKDLEELKKSILQKALEGELTEVSA